MLNYGPAVLILFSIFVGILMSRRDFTTLKADMDKQFDRIDKQFDRIDKRLDALTARVSALETDYTQFYGMQQKVEGRLDEISARVK